MTTRRAFYSVVQYCPDRFRAEAVNVGLILICPEPQEARVRITEKFERVRKLFGVSRDDLKNLKLAMHGLQSRIENGAHDFRTAEDLAAFAASRANDLRLTEPRLAKLVNIDEDFERLFADLVAAQAVATLADASPTEALPRELDKVFNRLSAEQRMWKPGEITVPVYNRKLEIPYAYRNGIVNFVKPHVFPANKHASSQAASLAVNGDLINRYPIDGEKGQLIVVSTQETAEQTQEIDAHVEPLFREYRVRLVRPQFAAAFAAEVEESAH